LPIKSKTPDQDNHAETEEEAWAEDRQSAFQRQQEDQQFFDMWQEEIDNNGVVESRIEWWEEDNLKTDEQDGLR
jgi:hypothetical protein